MNGDITSSTAPPAPLPRRRNAVLRLYDAPLYRDWAFWSTLVWGLISAISIPTSDEPTEPSPLPLWLDTLLAIILMTATFGLVPAWLRLHFRRWRWKRHLRTASAPPPPATAATAAPSSSRAMPAPAPPGPVQQRVPTGRSHTSPSSPRHDLTVSPMLTRSRETMPHPVARAVRSLQRANSEKDRYETLLDASEVLAVTVSVTAAAILNGKRAHHAHGTHGEAGAREEGAGERNLSALRSAYLTRGAMFGTWTVWLDELAPLVQARPGLVPGLLEGLCGEPGGPGLTEHLNVLRDERNRAAHGDKPQSQHEAALRVAEHAPHLERALDGVRFLEGLPWLNVVSCSFRPRDRTYDVVTHHVMGDHPDFESRSFIWDEPVGNDMLYVQTPDGPVPLSPFAAMGFCPQCRQVEVCYTYRAGKRGNPAMLKSFATGHEIPAPELDEEILTLPERVRDGRR